MTRLRKGEEGHLMLALMVILALGAIASTVATQAWVDVVQRENEAEMMFRAQEIARAIVRYQRDRPGQPLTELKLLVEPGSKGQYFIRQLYDDPLVRDGKWGLLYAGPNNTIIDPNSAEGSFQLGADGQLKPTGGLQGGFQQGGPREIGGLPIVGVKSLCQEKPFRIYKNLTSYSEWKFTIHDVLRGSPTQGQGRGPGAGQMQPGERQSGGRPVR